MTSTYVKFYSFVEESAKGAHHLHAAGDTLKVYLTNNAPSQSLDLLKADLVGITEGAGYGYDPVDIQNDVSRTDGTVSLTGVDVTWTCTAGGTIGPFQYAVVYNDTHASDALVCYWDYGSAVTLNPGESFKVDFGTELFTLT